MDDTLGIVIHNGYDKLGIVISQNMLNAHPYAIWDGPLLCPSRPE